MNAISITSFGPPEVLQLIQIPDPTPGPGELLIKVAASGINRPDILQRKGHYPPPAGVTDIPGLEVAGTIVGGDEHAMNKAGFRLGDSVCALLAGGGYAQLCVAPVAQCLPVPKGLSLIEAASLPETFFTVWSNLIDRARLQKGETLLIQGGSSGIGVAAIGLAKSMGCTVIVTAGTDEKCQACVALGADYAINYKIQDFVLEVKRIAPNGVNVVLDMVAGSYVARELECLADDGRLAIIAVQGGAKAEINAAQVLVKRLSIMGSTLRARPVAFKAAIANALRENIWPQLAGGQIKPVVHSTFAAGHAAQAHALMESNQHIGKIVLTWAN